MNRPRRLDPIVLLAGLLPAGLLLFGSGMASATDDPGTRADLGRIEAPRPQGAEAFDFLLGSWSCHFKRLMPDGTISEGPCRWESRHAAAGHIMVDEYRSIDPAGQAMLGVNVRSYDAETGKWTTRWYDALTGQWLVFEAEATEFGIEGFHDVEGPDGPATFRIRFLNIQEDSFQWQGDLSADGGKTWKEGVMRIQVIRSSTDEEQVHPSADVADPENIQLEFENSSVRITRATYEAGGHSTMHSHGNRVNVFLTDALFEVTLPDGEVFESSGKAGEVAWSEASSHTITARSPSQVITVEIKDRTGADQ